MRIERQKEELAKMDDPTISGLDGKFAKYIDGRFAPFYETYNSHDALQRVIDGFNASKYNTFVHELWKLIPVNKGIMQATPAQKREAILRAVGKWEEDDEES